MSTKPEWYSKENPNRDKHIDTFCGSTSAAMLRELLAVIDSQEGEEKDAFINGFEYARLRQLNGHLSYRKDQAEQAWKDSNMILIYSDSLGTQAAEKDPDRCPDCAFEDDKVVTPCRECKHR